MRRLDISWSKLVLLSFFVFPVGWVLAEGPKPSSAPSLPAPVHEQAPSQPKQAPTALKQEGGVGEFTIKGEAANLLDSEKPKLEVNIKERDVLAPTLETDPNAFKLNEPSEEHMETSLVSSVHSSFVVEPKFFRLKWQASAYEISLKRERNAILAEDVEAQNRPQALSWNLRVVDATGKVFASFEGKGLPPEEIRVPIQNAKEETFVVGAAYSGVLSYLDSKNQSHTVLARSFKVPAFIERGPKGFIAHLALENLFENNVSAPLLSDGVSLLQELADWMKLQNQIKAPMEAVVFSKDGKRAQAQTKEAVKKLGELLMRDDLEGSLNITVKPIGSDETERLNLTLFIPSEAVKPLPETTTLSVDKPGQTPRKKKKRFLFW